MQISIDWSSWGEKRMWGWIAACSYSCRAKDTHSTGTSFICNVAKALTCFAAPILNKRFYGPQTETKWKYFCITGKKKKVTKQCEGNIHFEIFIADRGCNSTSNAWADQITELSVSVLLTRSYTESLQVHGRYKVSQHDMWDVQRWLKSYNNCTHFLSWIWQAHCFL